MSDVLLLYLFTRVDVVLFAAVVVLIVGVAASLIYAAETGELPRRWALVTLICAGLTVVFVPSQKSLAIIIGGKIALDAARSPDAKEIGALVVDQVKEVLKK